MRVRGRGNVIDWLRALCLEVLLAALMLFAAVMLIRRIWIWLALFAAAGCAGYVLVTVMRGRRW